jgi:hypothetical protein
MTRTSKTMLLAGLALNLLVGCTGVTPLTPDQVQAKVESLSANPANRNCGGEFTTFENVMNNGVFDACIKNANAKIYSDEAALMRENTARTLCMKAEDTIIMGWSSNQLLASPCWGSPAEINSTKVGTHSHDQWVYKMSPSIYVYFTNGIVTAVQD